MNKTLILGILIVIVLVSGCTTQTAPETDQTEDDYEEQNQQTETHTEGDSSAHNREDIWSPLYTELQGCENKKITFTASPLDIESIAVTEPQGELTGFSSGHITPGDHIGFQYNPDGPALNVYAPADGFLARVERQPRPIGYGIEKDIKNYHLYFEYSCSFFSSYVHVTELEPEFASMDPELYALDAGPHPETTTSIWIRVPIKAGQLIGKTEAFGLLGMLTVDSDVMLTGFTNITNYEGEPWKQHAVPPFDYFEEPIKTQLLEKNPRTKEPVGGKIDFDVDGALAGNWFREGTNKYQGTAEQGYCGDYLCPYWDGHLAFVRDFVDPDQIRVSIGYDSGVYPQGPYGVRGNAPEPETISVNSGLIKYELLGLESFDEELGLITYGKAMNTRSDESAAAGIMIIQMLDAQKIKIEIVPSKTASEVSTFTSEALVYER